MSNTIILKKSSVAGKVPLASDLQVGELAVNLVDSKLYSKDASGTVIEVGGAASVPVTSVNGKTGAVVLDKADVGLANVDNIADANKSVASAAILTTARAINGTNFNGSAAITTANWGTARTLTIGATGKSVNGSANVSWTLAEIGIPQIAAQAFNTANITGTTTPAAISFGNTAFNTSNWASGTPTRLTATAAGVYSISLTGLVTFTTETYVLTFSLRRNGTEVRQFVFRENWRWFDGDTFTVQLNEHISLAANDYLEIFHSGDSTGYSIGTAANARAQFTIVKVA